MPGQDLDGRLLAYQLSRGGDEESLLRVMDVATGEDVDGPIDRCRYTGVAWLPGSKAFYYTRRLPPEAVPDGEQQYHRRVYLHQVGSPAGEDVMIFGDGLEKTNYYSVSVSRDGRWLIIGAAAGTAPRNDLWIADLTATSASAPSGSFRSHRPMPSAPVAATSSMSCHTVLCGSEVALTA